MSTKKQDGTGGVGEQSQDSRQSARQGEARVQTGKPIGTPPASGIGSSQGQDRETRRERAGRPSAGTADIERGGHSQDVERGGTQDSLVNDSVGAYKERP